MLDSDFDENDGWDNNEDMYSLFDLGKEACGTQQKNSMQNYVNSADVKANCELSLKQPLCSTPMQYSQKPKLRSVQVESHVSPIPDSYKTPDSPLTSSNHPTAHMNNISLFNGHTKTTKKRMFPGPAGALPKLKKDSDLRRMKSTYIDDEEVLNNGSVDTIQPSQMSQPCELSTNPVWCAMVRDLELTKEYLQKHCIKNIVTNAIKKTLPDGKAPFLAVIVDNICKSSPDAIVSLRDDTGRLVAVVHRHLVKQFQEELRVGSVLLLKQAAVFSPTARKQYLNITPNNLLQIYSHQDQSLEVKATLVNEHSGPWETLLTQPIAVQPIAVQPKLHNTADVRPQRQSLPMTFVSGSTVSSSQVRFTAHPRSEQISIQNTAPHPATAAALHPTPKSLLHAATTTAHSSATALPQTASSVIAQSQYGSHHSTPSVGRLTNRPSSVSSTKAVQDLGFTVSTQCDGSSNSGNGIGKPAVNPLSKDLNWKKSTNITLLQSDPFDDLFDDDNFDDLT